MMRRVKSSSKDLFPTYLIEFMWRENNTGNVFTNFLVTISEQYPFLNVNKFGLDFIHILFGLLFLIWGRIFFNVQKFEFTTVLFNIARHSTFLSHLTSRK
jgi:hypothetical protein